jgi:hypothetical protein
MRESVRMRLLSCLWEDGIVPPDLRTGVLYCADSDIVGTPGKRVSSAEKEEPRAFIIFTKTNYDVSELIPYF